VSPDPLDAILELAVQEGALSRETLPEFARALRERAALVLGERVAGLEEHVANLERELSWRKQEQERLEAEIAWRKTNIEELEGKGAWLEENVARLEAENAWRKETGEAAQREAVAALDNAKTAHDRLLDHHRTMLRELAARLQGLGSGPIWHIVRLRRQLRELAASLSGEGS
jgi:septal ring factor EnvC (AmiA/AmiB activator)